MSGPKILKNSMNPDTVLTEEDIVFYRMCSNGYRVPWTSTSRIYLWRMNVLSITEISVSSRFGLGVVSIDFISNINYYVGDTYTSANTKKTTCLVATLENIFSEQEIEQLMKEKKIKNSSKRTTTIKV